MNSGNIPAGEPFDLFRQRFVIFRIDWNHAMIEKMITMRLYGAAASNFFLGAWFPKKGIFSMSGLKEIRLGAASDDDQGQLIYSYEPRK